MAKLGQPLAWGSDAWICSYSRRTHVEGIFGNVKDAKTADLQRGWIFIVGMVKTSLMLAAVAVATNIRLLRKWAARSLESCLATLLAPALVRNAGASICRRPHGVAATGGAAC